ncbi:hypothetical protein L9F63_007401, partial [Diploptera punctata]
VSFNFVIIYHLDIYKMQEEYSKLPWYTAKDTGFIDESSLKSQSSTYKILHGTLHKVFSSDSEDDDGGKGTQKEMQSLADSFEKQQKLKRAHYIPAYFMENKIKFGKTSSLSKNQQELYMQLKVKQSLTECEMKQFELLHTKLIKERYEFTTFVRSKCALRQDRYMFLNLDIKKFVEELWQHKLNQVVHSPATYESLRMVPLVYSDNKRPIVMKMEKTLLELGSIPYVIWPKFNNVVTVDTDYGRMIKNFPPKSMHPEHPKVKLHKEQVSKDKNAEKLAVNNDADIVICANALKHIADNHGPSFDRSWDICVSVRECTDPDTGASRKVVFVDKPLPPRTLTTGDKNHWYYRIGVKPILCHSRHPKAFRFHRMQNYDTRLLEAKEVKNDSKCNVGSLKRKHEDDEKLIDLSDTDNDIKCKEKSMDTNSEWTLPPMRSNVSYRLWKMYKDNYNKDEQKGDFLKGDHTNREIKLIVRCKTDGYEKDDSFVYVVPKIEYQTEFGAERVSKSELTQQWMSLFVRPQTMLCRVRLNICTSEVIMIEKLSPQELTQESVQLDNSPVSPVLGNVYNILLSLVDLTNGNYLVSHTPQSGAFVNLRYYTRTGRYNLHDKYKVNPFADPENDIFLWNEIDYRITTPYQQAFSRVPGTFPPAVK